MVPDWTESPPSRAVRRDRAWPWVLVGWLLLSPPACAPTLYRPTVPRPALGPGVQVDVVSVRGAASVAEVSIRTQQPSLIGPISWASADSDACSAPQALPVGRDAATLFADGDPAPFRTTGPDDVVFVNLGTAPEIARAGMTIDFKVDTGAAQGCLRVPLTATGTETLWQAPRTPWIVSFGVRVDDPLGRLGGTGARLVSEVRIIHSVGPLRAFFGFTLGGSTCRGADCPPFMIQGDDSDSESSGLFVQFGGEAGLERRIAIRRWSLGLTAGAGIAVFHLGAPPDYAGERNGGLAGPFASISLFGPSGGAIPGFAPAARRRSNGPELFARRETAFGRGPTQSAWVAGFGWRFEGTQ